MFRVGFAPGFGDFFPHKGDPRRCLLDGQKTRLSAPFPILDFHRDIINDRSGQGTRGDAFIPGEGVGPCLKPFFLFFQVGLEDPRITARLDFRPLGGAFCHHQCFFRHGQVKNHMVAHVVAWMENRFGLSRKIGRENLGDFDRILSVTGPIAEKNKDDHKTNDP